MLAVSQTFIRQAYVLGFAGLLPFWTITVALYWPGAERWPFLPVALTTYAGLIASFLGGIYWGLALRHGQLGQLWWSVLPAILVWFLSFLPFKQEVSALILLFLLLLLVEGFWLRRASEWCWFWRLRQYLTFFVCAALALAWFAA